MRVEESIDGEVDTDRRLEHIRQQAAHTDLLGLVVDEVGEDRVVLRCPVESMHLQANGIVHGGVYCWLVESAASIGAAGWFHDRGHVVGVSNHTNFLRAVRSGVLTATATPLQRGRTRQIWQVCITNGSAGLVAQGELHVSNIVSTSHLARERPMQDDGGRVVTDSAR